MLGLSLESAKQLAIVIAIGLLVIAVLSAWVIKNVTTKLVVVLLAMGLALGVWTQRTSLQECADRARERIEELGDTSELTCTFFGSEVNLPFGD